MTVTPSEVHRNKSNYLIRGTYKPQQLPHQTYLQTTAVTSSDAPKNYNITSSDVPTNRMQQLPHQTYLQTAAITSSYVTSNHSSYLIRRSYKPQQLPHQTYLQTRAVTTSNVPTNHNNYLNRRSYKPQQLPGIRVQATFFRVA